MTCNNSQCNINDLESDVKCSINPNINSNNFNFMNENFQFDKSDNNDTNEFRVKTFPPPSPSGGPEKGGVMTRDSAYKVDPVTDRISAARNRARTKGGGL